MGRWKLVIKSRRKIIGRIPHDELGDDEIIENMEIDLNNDKNEMLQKLFEMVEKYTEIIICLENELKQ